MTVHDRGAKARIADALVDILAEGCPDRDVPVKELIRRSGVNRSTYYYHFHRVDEVFSFLIDSFADEFERVLTGFAGHYAGEEASDVLLDGNLEVLRYVYDHRREFLVLMGSQHRDYFRYRLARVFRKTFEGYDWIAAEDGQDKALTYTERRFCAFFSGYGMYGLIECWAKRSFEDTPEEVSAMVGKLIQSSLVSFGRTV